MPPIVELQPSLVGVTIGMSIVRHHLEDLSPDLTSPSDWWMVIYPRRALHTYYQLDMESTAFG